LAPSLSSLSSRAVALRSEVGVCFGGFVGGSTKEEILAWREAEVRGRTSSWLTVALWSEVGVCFGGFVGGSVGVNCQTPTSHSLTIHGVRGIRRRVRA
jgi:hypothetical protein